VKSRAVLVLFLIVFGAFSFLAPGTSAALPALPLDIGYSPSELFPVSGGTPVYTAGDQLWARSHSNSTIQVTLTPLLAVPTPAPTYARSLGPGVPVRILTFNSTDAQGLWSLRGGNLSYQGVLFIVNDATARPANLTLSSYRLVRSSLDLNFTSSPFPQMYDAKACVLGGSDDSTARVSLPSTIGTGYVNMSSSGYALQVLASGPRAVNYTFSVELYRSFSFLVPNSTSALVSRMSRVATTGSEPLSGGEQISLTLQPDIPLAPGTYEVRAFFEGANGASLSATDVLIAGSGGWTWLGGCRTYPVYSNDFTLAVPLGSDPATWPTSLWLSYRLFGEEGLAYVPLGLRLAAIDFIGAPWGVKLPNYRISVVYTAGVQQYAVSNGTLYAVLDGPSAQAGYRAGLGNHFFFTGAASSIAPFTVSTVSLDVSRLVVRYLVGGAGYGGGVVSVSDSTGRLAKGTTDSSGLATFYLPTGRYNVTASGGNSTSSGFVSVVAGQSQELVLGAGGGSGAEPMLLLGLYVAAIIGVVANVAAWLRGRGRGPVGQRTSPSQK